MKIFFATVIMCLLSAQPGFAVKRSLKWAPVKTCVDGSRCLPDSYVVYRQAGANKAFIRLAEVTAAAYTDKNAPRGMVSYYVTAASKRYGESAPSNSVKKGRQGQ